ncbi:MAG: hypothetical protein KIT58_23670 [Planctomycetota bacterium]|nr:hypothetical protein [Planctomycetota bacterium]
MTRFPSYLVGLRKTRARAAGDIERLERLASELAGQTAKARAVVEACDVLIRKFDGRLDPTGIAPIRGNTRYGKRGDLVRAIEEELHKAQGEAVTTVELAIALQARFGLDFESWEARRRWVKNSVTPALKDMVAAGLVERLHDAESRSGETGRWRLTPRHALTLAQLQASAEAAGVPTLQADEAG